MPINNAEKKLISVSVWEAYCNKTSLGLVSTDNFDFDDGSKTSEVKAGITGDAALKLFQKTGNCKAKFKLISTNAERIKMFYNALTYVNGSLAGNTESAKELKSNIWTFIPKQILADGTEYNEINMSPDAIQFPAGVATNGFGFKSKTDKEHEYDVEVMGLPDLNQRGYPSWKKGKDIVLPPAGAMFVNMLTPGAGYTVKPTGGTVTGVTGFACEYQTRADGTLNVIITNPGTAADNLIGTFVTLTIVGGTSTTPATAQVYIG
jgi:hypothetical protein